MSNSESLAAISGSASGLWCGGRTGIYTVGLFGAVLLDAATPLSIADWLIEVVLVLMAATWGGAIEVIVVGAGATVAICAGLWSSPPGPCPLWVCVLNRLAAIGIIWAVVRVAWIRADAEKAQAKAAAEVKVLRGLLPVCAVCKRIRTAGNQWHSMEAYITSHSEAHFTHTYCPKCADHYYVELGRTLGPKP
jgi:hypothetical protein